MKEEFCEAQGDQYGLMKENVLASGAFTLTQWQPWDTVAALTKNDNYYDAENIEVNSITFETIKDNQQAIMAWESVTDGPFRIFEEEGSHFFPTELGRSYWKKIEKEILRDQKSCVFMQA